MMRYIHHVAGLRELGWEELPTKEEIKLNRSSCSTDTFDKPVRSLSEVGPIAPASAMIPLATALPSPGLPSLTLMPSAFA